MTKRSLEAVRARTLAISLRWPLSVARTVFTGCVLVALCFTADSNGTVSTLVTPCVPDISVDYCSSVFDSMEQLMMSFLALACVNLFLRRRQTSHSEQARYRLRLYWRGGVRTVILAVIAAVYIASLLLSCGDVESNPGPVTGKEPGKDRSSVASSSARTKQDLDFPLSLLRDEIAGVNEAVIRMGSVNQRQGQVIQETLVMVEDKIDRRLQQIEETQNQLTDDIRDIQAHCRQLREENSELKDSVHQLQDKCDYLENQSRRNNLVFFGLPLETSWTKCEQAVKQVIREGLGIDQEIHVERAHSTGRAIVVRFLSFKQRSLVLSQARKLKESEKFRDVFIKEDVSINVQQKRKALRSIQRDLHSRGQTAKLRFDKLITDSAVYEFDSGTQRVVSKERSARQRTGGNRWRQQNPAQHREDGSTNVLLPVDEFPSLASSRRAVHLSTDAAPGQINRESPVERRRQQSNRESVTRDSRQPRPETKEQKMPSARASTNSDVDSCSTRATPHHRKYNLRTRGAADMAAEGDSSTRDTCKGVADPPVQSREKNASSISSSPCTPRGLGRGRGRPSPSQTRIDSMFRVPQPDPAPVTDTVDHSVVSDQTEDPGLDSDDTGDPDS